MRFERLLSRLRGQPIDYDLKPHRKALAEIQALEPEMRSLSDHQIGERAAALKARVQDGLALDAGIPDAFALVRESARRVLGQRLFDEQILTGLAILRGQIAEAATGEGKTLAAVAPVFLSALAGQGVHVLTFNDYLARRDAAWMGPIYRLLGLDVGAVQQSMTTAERQRAYRADVTYVTAKEAGFDYLRDGLVIEPADEVHRPFHFALVDEADSILIDEARIPLVIAGETGGTATGPERMAALVRTLRAGVDFDTDEFGHNVALTEAGATRAEAAVGVGSLFAEANVGLLGQLRNALHAEYLLTRDVDYIVRRGRVELVDDFTGRVAEKRHWPDGLQAAVEAKEGVRLQAEGKILGSITLQHFLRLYPKLAGMTATARPAADELAEFYGTHVAVVPTHAPMIRVDQPDLVFTHKEAKQRAVVAEITRAHKSGQPVLVGTANVTESERLADELRRSGIACQVLNAKNDEAEAEIVARAGALGAVTISTNMAGRGTDIRLGGPDESERDVVVACGGLYVIGTNRHESRRVDDQLRGRSGRQGDPGASRFFVSLEDDLIQRYGVERLISTKYLPARQEAPLESRLVRAEIARAQRIIENESFVMRQTLFAYSEPVEKQRLAIQGWRGDALERRGRRDTLAERCAERWARCEPQIGREMLCEIERRVTLAILDRCWSDYLAEVREMRDDSLLLAFAGKLPLPEFHRQVGESFLALEDHVQDEIARTFDSIVIGPAGVDWDNTGLRGPAATWTYLVGENPFGASGMLSPAGRTGSVFAAATVPLLMLAQGLALLRKRRAEREARKADGG